MILRYSSIRNMGVSLKPEKHKIAKSSFSYIQLLLPLRFCHQLRFHVHYVFIINPASTYNVTRQHITSRIPFMNPSAISAKYYLCTIHHILSQNSLHESSRAVKSCQKTNPCKRCIHPCLTVSYVEHCCCHLCRHYLRMTHVT